MTMEITNENGNIILENNVFKDIAEIAALKVSGVYPNKKNDFAEVKIKEDQLYVLLHVKLKQDIDIVKTCSKVQAKVRESLEGMTGIPVGTINVDIQGFVKEKKEKEKKEKDVEKTEEKTEE